jgi:hypothetical protein
MEKVAPLGNGLGMRWFMSPRRLIWSPAASTGTWSWSAILPARTSPIWPGTEAFATERPARPIEGEDLPKHMLTSVRKMFWLIGLIAPLGGCNGAVVKPRIAIESYSNARKQTQMKHKNLLTIATIRAGFLLNAALNASASGPARLSPQEQLGKNLFFDQNLSAPAGQSCAACHGPDVGFTGPTAAINAGGAVYEGAVNGRFGNRKPPTAADAGDSPVLHFDNAGEVFVGGMFWDGRAIGWTLGGPLAEQAQGPFLNPLEQNNARATAVVEKVAPSSHAMLFEQVWGPGSFSLAPENVPSPTNALRGQSRPTSGRRRSIRLAQNSTRI